jgi:hypothetical protein
MPLIQGQAVNSSNAGGFYPKTIEGSLRFNSADDAHLEWTPSGAGTSGTTFTISCWVKLAALDENYIFSAGASGATTEIFYIQTRSSSNGYSLSIVWRDGSTTTRSLVTNRKFKDTSAWYHVVVAVNAGASLDTEKIKVYINGERETSFSTDNRSTLSSSSSLVATANVLHYIGGYSVSGSTFADFYLAEYFFIDGTQHDADAFGEFNNGIWVPKNITASDFTMGNNGFYLNFEDDATVEAFNTVLYEGNGNTTNRIYGAGFQPDFVWIKGRSFVSGHQQYDSVRGATKRIQSHSTNAQDTQATGLKSFDSDGFTVGALSTSNTDNANLVSWCWDAGGASQSATYVVKVVSDSGNKYRFDDFGTSAITLELSEGGTYRFDQADGSNSGHPIRFSTTSDGTHGGGSEYTTGVTTNGTPGSAGAYTEITVASGAPTLYYYCTQHSGMGGQANTPSTKGYTNVDGTTQSTVVANDTTGFSVVSYTGSTNESVGHGLSSAPDWIVVKDLDATSSWAVYHQSVQDATANGFLELNTTAAVQTGSNPRFQSATAGTSQPTNSVFYVRNYSGSSTNATGNAYIAYCWTETTGVSKFGTYEGNHTAGVSVTCGFKPGWVMVKNIDAAGSWEIYDNTRNTLGSGRLEPDTTDAEPGNDEAGVVLGFGTNGFNLAALERTASNKTGNTYIYAAFADTRDAAFWLDQSSNNNDWQPENLDYMDSLSDSPTNNFSTMNGNSAYGGTLSEGNLNIAMDAGSTRPNNIGVSSGKWYWEVTIQSNNWSIGLTNGDNFEQRIHTDSSTSLFDFGRGSSVNTGGIERASNSTKSYDNHTPNVTTGTYGFALDLDAANPKCDIYYNGTLAYTFDTFTIAGPYFFGIDRWNGTPTTSHNVNFGQLPFVYGPPS